MKGEYQVEAPAELLTNDLSILDQFTIVIGTNLNEKTALDFSDYLWGLQIPFIHARYDKSSKFRSMTGRKQ